MSHLRCTTAQVLALWAVLQVPLAVSLGHWYDVRVAMAAGRLAATGQNPWLPETGGTGRAGGTGGVPELFGGAPGIGYPPPAALIDALAYQLSWRLVPDPFLYNFVLKLPWIGCHAGLAFLAARMRREAGAGEADAGRTFRAVLFNPLIILCTAAWGQVDAGVALLGLAALAAFTRGRGAAAGSLGAAAVALKPTALPFVVALLAAPQGLCRRGKAALAASGALAAAVLVVLPFPILGWSPRPILEHWSYHTSVAGGLSIFSALELVTGTTTLPAPLWWVGWLWLPALAFGTASLRHPARRATGVVSGATVLVLLFLLARAWVSEPNLVMLVPLALIAASDGGIPWKTYHALWALPLVFAILNESLPQMLFLLDPGIIGRLARLDERVGTARLALRTAGMVPWVAVGWWTTIRLLGRRGEPA